LEAVLNNLQLTKHGFERGITREIYPGWLHFSTAEEFVVQVINRTENKQVKEYGTLTKIILPTFKAYVRNGNAIVTLVRRRRKIG